MRWLNLRCLDAPLVAVAWQAFLADAFSVRVRAVARVVLFLTVWVIYLGDRLADVRSLVAGGPMSARQAFCHQHGRAWLRLLGVLAVVDALLVALFVRRAVISVGLVLGAVCLVYLFANRFADRAWRYLPIKELTIGSLFAIGTVAPLIPSEAATRAGFSVAVALFAWLCALNCVAIASWERELDERQGKHSIGTTWPWLGHYLPALTSGLAILGVLAALQGWVPAGVGWSVGATAIVLGLLSRARWKLGMDDRTALADLSMVMGALPALLLQRGSG